MHDSIVGSRFHARVQEHTREHGRAAVVPVITGAAYRVGTSTFEADPYDTLVPGFVLR
ncbi:proline racemase family protein [Arthrobacter sp. GCM10027362]|uniref:proline racemase family protein n=1 Tax=Arthrobacter sp. GCM10027362 TaxID=3273379 RepID=UPI0036445090